MKSGAALSPPIHNSTAACWARARSTGSFVVALPNSKETKAQLAASDDQMNRTSFVHNWANDAIKGHSEAGLTALLAASRASDSHELEFVVSGGFYAFWQLIVWAVYDTRGRAILSELASAWRKHGNAATKEQLSRHLLRKALSVAEITGENDLVEFCQGFVLIVTADQWKPVQ